jgi:hypothetical protein
MGAIPPLPPKRLHGMWWDSFRFLVTLYAGQELLMPSVLYRQSAGSAPLCNEISAFSHSIYQVKYPDSVLIISVIITGECSKRSVMAYNVLCFNLLSFSMVSQSV